MSIQTNAPQSRPYRAKRGELLHYRRRPAAAQTPAPLARDEAAVVIIQYGGRKFRVTPAMAENFLTRAQRVLAAHDAQLVALLHEGGPDMLFVADHIPFDVGDSFQYRPAQA